MLLLLHIENIAVIQSADIQFDAGFNVLTGETGAGKSIVVDALNAVLGDAPPETLSAPAPNPPWSAPSSSTCLSWIGSRNRVLPRTPRASCCCSGSCGRTGRTPAV